MTGATASVHFDLSMAELQETIHLAPVAVYRSVRNFLFFAMADHRARWLAGKSTRFGRASSSSRAIQVFRINEGPTTPRENHVVYSVLPKERTFPTPEAAADGLAALRAEVFTGNLVLKVHEFGMRIAPGAWMALPQRAKRGVPGWAPTPELWHKRNPGKQLVAHALKDGRILLNQVVEKRGRGRPSASGAPKVTKVLVARFALVRSIQMKPTLHFYANWDQLVAQRATKWKAACDRIQEDIISGKP